MAHVENVDAMASTSILTYIYRYAPHNDVSVNDGPHIRRGSQKIYITLHYITFTLHLHYNYITLHLHYITLHYHCVTIAYTIQYSNMQYRFEPRSNRLYHIDYVCSRLYSLGLCRYTFAQRRNRPTTHFSDRIPGVQRRISLCVYAGHAQSRIACIPDNCVFILCRTVIGCAG